MFHFSLFALFALSCSLHVTLFYNVVLMFYIFGPAFGASQGVSPISINFYINRCIFNSDSSSSYVCIRTFNLDNCIKKNGFWDSVPMESVFSVFLHPSRHVCPLGEKKSEKSHDLRSRRRLTERPSGAIMMLTGPR